MARVPDWTVDEFETLLNNYGLSDKELARELPKRSLGAIELVRDAIHSYHTDRMFISALSGMMRRRLGERRGSLVCSRCGIALGTEGGIKMLGDAWLKMVGALTPEDIKLLKARGCASELFVFLEAFDKLVLAWQRTEPPPIDKRGWADIQTRLNQLQAALHEE